MGKQRARLDRLAAAWQRRPPPRPRPDLSVLTDHEIDELAELAHKAKRGKALDAADEAILARIQAAAERREVGRP